MTSWEIARHDDPGLRWVCARCHLIGAEHASSPWWCCDGRWIDVSWEQGERLKVMTGHALRCLFGFGFG